MLGLEWWKREVEVEETIIGREVAKKERVVGTMGELIEEVPGMLKAEGSL